MESEIIRKFYKHNFQLHKHEESFNKKSEETQNQNPNDQLSNSIDQIPLNLNNISQEHNRRIPLLSPENLTFNSSIYQEYTKSYQKFTSLYYAALSGQDKTKMIIYDTKSANRKTQVIDLYIKNITESQYITQLPNGNLFWFCNAINNNITKAFLIDSDFHLHELPSGSNIYSSSAIYYNRSVYCFGGHEGITFGHRGFSSRFDLNKKLWVSLSPVPEHASSCTTVVFNGNILISGTEKVHIWLYSIDIDSFSVIPFKFILKRKVMVNAEERLYLIQRTGHWCIYESGIWDVFSWKLIGIIESVGTSYCEVHSCIYNKEKESIYILSLEYDKNRQKSRYWKFNLNEKVLNEEKKEKNTEKIDKKNQNTSCTCKIF